jgi:hypothetical protein
MTCTIFSVGISLPGDHITLIPFASDRELAAKEERHTSMKTSARAPRDGDLEDALCHGGCVRTMHVAARGDQHIDFDFSRDADTDGVFAA